MKVIDILTSSRELLKNKSFDSPALDCKILLGKVLGITNTDLVFNSQRELTNKEIESFNKLIKRRLNHEPVAKIINEKSFWNYSFYVNSDVLDPRPDTENLIELVLDDYKNIENLNILDLGCGSGCIILTLLKLLKNSKGTAVDLSEKALEIAKKNAKILKVNNIDFKKSNWNDSINDKFDIIVSNPPYISTSDIENLANDVKNFDPKIALDGGVDGLDYYKYIAKNIKKNCKNNTKLYFEVGQNQAQNVKNIFLNENFTLFKIKKDLNKIERVLSFNIKNSW